MTENGCQVEWPCAFEEWKDFCEERMKLSYTVSPGLKVEWLVSYIILGFTVIGDIREHAKYFKASPIPYKVLLLVQMWVCSAIFQANAKITAG